MDNQEWIDLLNHPNIENGARVWFANEFGIWSGIWDIEELHKGCGRAYPEYVMVMNIPKLPCCYDTNADR